MLKPSTETWMAALPLTTGPAADECAVYRTTIETRIDSVLFPNYEIAVSAHSFNLLALDSY